MKRDLIDRRERTFELLIVKGCSYADTVETISREYDITESGVRSDISRMNDWLPDLVDEDYAQKDGLVRLKELRKNRQEMRQLYEEFKDQLKHDPDRDPRMLINILEKIDANIDLDIALSQSLGHTEREPAQLEVEHEMNVSTDVVEVTREDVQEDETDE